MRYSILFILFVFCFLEQGFTQSNFSESFFYMPRNIHILVPSSACVDKDIQANVVFRSYIGNLSVIRTYYADINLNLQQNKKDINPAKKHIVGLGIYNDREGDFFTKFRGILRYALHLPVTDKLYFAAGTAIHVINYNFNTPAAGASGSALTWSGNISSTLYSSRFRLAISLNDFNSPDLRPINYDFRIPRYLTLYLEKSLEIKSGLEIRASGRCNWVSGIAATSLQPASFYLVQAGLDFSKEISASGLLYINKGWGMSVELKNIKLYQNSLDLSFLYFVPFKSYFPTANQFEINLQYSFLKN
jgi:hypothetical protein